MKDSLNPAGCEAVSVEGRALVRIVLLGPPGAGKGSLASLYKLHLGLAHLSTGQIFRQEIARNSGLGRRVKRYVTNGSLVPDQLVVTVMAAHVGVRGPRTGFVLDGFPRTVRQAEGLDRVLETQHRALDGVIYLTSPESLLVRRLSGRRVCKQCGENYHIRTRQPKRSGRCDRCGGHLIVRTDDQPMMIKKRLMIDRRASQPLLGYYRRRGLLHPVDGRGRVERVYARTLRLFDCLGWLRHDRTQDPKRN